MLKFTPVQITNMALKMLEENLMSMKK